MLSASPVYLVCPPDYYTVSYAINAWMKPDVWQAEKERWTERAREQWSSLTSTMEKLGWTLRVIPPDPHLPDMVFSANHALVIEKKALIARYLHKERQGETPLVLEWFSKAGFQAKVSDGLFEGAGDALYAKDKDIIFMGHGFRTSLETARELEAFFQKKVVPLSLKDPRFYHLDTCFCPLDGGWALYTPLAFSDESRAQLQHYYGDRLLAMPDDDAVAFACNAVNHQQDVILPQVSAGTLSMLTDRGFQPHCVNMDSFLLAGGACKCLTLRLDE